MIEPTKPNHKSTLRGNQRLETCAARARETDRLAQEAELEVARLRKEMKRARKAYREAKDAAKEAGKEAEKARAELSGCLDGAFRDLATAVQRKDNRDEQPQPKTKPAVQEESSDQDTPTLNPKVISG